MTHIAVAWNPDGSPWISPVTFGSRTEAEDWIEARTGQRRGKMIAVKLLNKRKDYGNDIPRGFKEQEPDGGRERV